MPAPTSVHELLDLTRKSGIIEDARLAAYIQQLKSQHQLPAEPSKLAGLMVRDALLTFFQAEQLLMGKWKRFNIGKYKVLEKLGAGGMGQVFLCEHKFMKRRVAIKVLPTAKADDPSSLQRFYREARVVASLDHLNIVRAYDIDQDDNLHFLVMEYVDGTNMQDLIKKHGPMDPLRACHYMHQSAHGLQHAFDAAGIIHRDIKPANILVDRSGAVKILDMGLARFFHDEDDLLTKQYDETVLGTADYLAPEQAIDSHGVDIRADIYSLGATFYFLLTGSPPFMDGTVAQKLIWHQTKEPRSISLLRPEVPKGIVAIVEKMMAKDANARYQMPRDIAEALAPFVETPIDVPPEHEMPQLSPAAMGQMAGTQPASSPSNRPSGPPSPAPSRGTTPSTARGATPAPRPPATDVPSRRTAAVDAPFPAATAQPAPAPPMEESPLWASFAAETPSPRASMAETGHNRALTRATSKRLRGVGSPTSPQSSQRTLWMMLVIIGLLLGVLGVGVAYAFGLFRSNKGPQPGPGAGAVVGPQTLMVDTNPTPAANTVSKIATALNRAKPGDTIRVRGPAVEEQWANVEANRFPKGVTVEADVAPGQHLPWRLPANATDLKAVLTIANMDGIRFRGFAFDGQGRAENGVYLHSRCAGVSFDDCSVMNCKEAGVKISNASGEANRPISFTRSRISGLPGAKAGLYLFASPSITGIKAVQHVRFRDCIIDGPTPSLVLVEGSASEVSFVNNRFFQATDGLVIRPLKETAWSDVNFKSNTFHQVVRFAVSNEGASDIAPPGSSFVFDSNLFTSCKTVYQQVGDKPLLKLASRDNGWDSASAEGNARIDGRMIGTVTYTSEDPATGRQFLRLANSSLPPGKPLGAHPID